MRNSVGDWGGLVRGEDWFGVRWFLGDGSLRHAGVGGGESRGGGFIHEP
jgi:hypothetical protein